MRSTNVFDWRGKVDGVAEVRRWHQQVKTLTTSLDDFLGAPVLAGFSCDEGVRRNQGRPGAKAGPEHLRAALANVYCDRDFIVYDLGNIECVDHDLALAQNHFADTVFNILQSNGRPILLGGGHEIAWSSFMGAQRYIEQHKSSGRLGIINFDAHFDLRNPSRCISSGTAFRQIHEYCEATAHPFNYYVFGISPSANAKSLFQYAQKHGVRWIDDVGCFQGLVDRDIHGLCEFLSEIDYLYMTVCLDVFSHCYAPGVSAPAAVGLSPNVVITFIRKIKALCRQQDVGLLLFDVAELNPVYDIDGQTAQLAARVIHEILS